MNDVVVVWASDPELPVVVTVYVVPTVPPLQLSVWLPDPPVIVLLLNEHVRPVGLVATVSVRVPEKLFMGETVIVVDPEFPPSTFNEVGFAETVKSWTYTVKVVLCESDPLVAVTVTW